MGALGYDFVTSLSSVLSVQYKVKVKVFRYKPGVVLGVPED
jgi:hypothetical protein